MCVCVCVCVLTVHGTSRVCRACWAVCFSGCPPHCKVGGCGVFPTTGNRRSANPAASRPHVAALKQASTLPLLLLLLMLLLQLLLLQLLLLNLLLLQLLLL